MKNKILLTVIAILLAVGGVFGISYGITMTLVTGQKTGGETIADLPSTSVNPVPSDSSGIVENPVATEPDQTDAEPVVIPVDFASYQEANPDIYAWIKIDDTPIDFPILQSDSDNAYYLRHTYKKEYNINGSIYTENYNAKDFSDYMTVVYGHTMKTGVMFTPLLQYMDNAFFDDHRTITIYTPDAQRIYTVFAAYEYDTRHLLLNMDFTIKRVRSTYLDYVMNIRAMNAQLADDVTVTADDRILTLSCCSMDGTARFLVQAVLTQEAFVQ